MLRQPRMLHWHGTKPGAAYPLGKHLCGDGLGMASFADKVRPASCKARGLG